jgi:peptidyl-dipeptidase A
MKKWTLYVSAAAFLLSCGQSDKSGGNEKFQQEVQAKLDDYNKKWQQLLIASAEAEWTLNTHIVEGDTITGKKAEEANKAFAEFTGSKENIEFAQTTLKKKEQLTPLQKKQVETILFMAGGSPATAGDLIDKRITAETEQTKKLFGYNFKLNGKSVSTNELDEILKSSTNLAERQKAWEVSKEVGKELKPGLVELQQLRNGVVKPLGYSDYFNYQVSEYNMTSDEMMKTCHDMISDIWPIYRELHTWARYTLAEKYKQPVPDMIPAHWVPNRWSQDWTAMIDVEGFDPDMELRKKSPEWIMEEGEKFYISLGFDSLPKTFYEKSSLYPAAADAGYKKNNHASAWHMDNDKDVRSLMSIEANAEWWETVLHELGHIYYYMSYSNPDVPIILRSGANRAYHEAMGTLIGLASMQKPFLEQYKLVPANVKVDQTQILMKEALNYVVMIPWSAGVMTEYEHDLYAKNLSKDEYNKRWWELVGKYQGIVPPTERGEEYCDAASKTHINNDAAQYYDYALSTVLLFQFHDHICNKILKQDVHSANYFGSKETGDFLRTLMKPGASVDWKEHLQNTLGTEMSAKPMQDYFAPLTEYLKKENEGRKYTLPEKI